MPKQTTLERAPKSARMLASPKRFRGDIQGLRTIAVMAVILDHLVHWPTGGFIGVDIFFVISGFLITGLLLKEHARTGKISFADFYRRRARRILPLAAIVLLFTVGAAYLIYNAGRFKTIAEDSAWSLLFGANWHFALIGTDYMNAGASVSPVQHFWSLAVEEQFYVMWPWLIVFVLGVLASGRAWTTARAQRILLSFMVLLTVSSFAFSIWETANAPTIAYFSTFSRAWELGIGAILAASVNLFSRIPEFVRTVAAYVGLAGIAWSLFWITPETAFPGPGATIPVLSTALVIAAGCGGQQAFLAPLTNPIMRYVGDISYSLYLWHFPFIIIVGSIVPFEGWVPLGTLLVIFAFSATSFHLLEDPIRRSSWLEPRRIKASKQPLKLNALPYVALLAVAAVLVGGGALWRDLGLRNQPTAAPPALTPAPNVGAAETIAQKQIRAINHALSASEWPELSPAIAEIGPESKAPEWVQDGCLALDRAQDPDPIANAAHCIYGEPSAAKKAVLLGDSMAVSYAGGIRDALVPAGYSVSVLTMQECPAVSVDVIKGDGSPHPQCGEFRNWALSQIAQMQPDVVFVSSARSGARRLASNAEEGPAANAEWAEGARLTFESLTAASPKVVSLDPPPGGKNIQECATKLSKPSDCATKVDAQYKDVAAAVRAGASKFTPSGIVVFPDVRAWFCSGESCPAFIGATPVYADTGHITNAFSKTLAPFLAELVK